MISNSTAVVVELERIKSSATVDEIDVNGLLAPKSTTIAINLNIDEFLELSFSHPIDILNKVSDTSIRSKHPRLCQADGSCHLPYELRYAGKTARGIARCGGPEKIAVTNAVCNCCKKFGVYWLFLPNFR